MSEKKKEGEKEQEEGEKDPYAAPDGGWGWAVMVARWGRRQEELK